MLNQLSVYRPESVRALAKAPQQQGLAGASEAQAADFNSFNSRDIQLMLKNSAACLQAGFPLDHPLLQTCVEIRADYIKWVGLPGYLGQMLGPAANVPAERCTFFQVNEPYLPLDLAGDDQQPIQRFLWKYLRRRPLCLKIEISREGPGDEVEVRYL